MKVNPKLLKAYFDFKELIGRMEQCRYAGEPLLIEEKYLTAINLMFLFLQDDPVIAEVNEEYEKILSDIAKEIP